MALNLENATLKDTIAALRCERQNETDDLTRLRPRNDERTTIGRHPSCKCVFQP